MHSDGFSSESDVSISSAESYSSVGTHRRVARMNSIESVCSHPSDDAYVMVLQNRKGLYDDLRCVISLKDLCDVTFLVGEERRSVHGVRAIIATRSRLFYQLILSHEKNRRLLKTAKKSTIRKTLSKLSKLACALPNEESPTKLSRSNGSNLTIPMETFDPESFQRFMNYIHCGQLTVDSNTVIGVMNAAYMFGFPEVQQACWDFAIGCAEREDNLKDLLESAKLYCDHRMTRSLMRTVSSMEEMRETRLREFQDRESQADEFQFRNSLVIEPEVRVVIEPEVREFQIGEPEVKEFQVRELFQVNETQTMSACASKFPDLLANHKLSDDLDSLLEEEEMLLT